MAAGDFSSSARSEFAVSVGFTPRAKGSSRRGINVTNVSMTGPPDGGCHSPARHEVIAGVAVSFTCKSTSAPAACPRRRCPTYSGFWARGLHHGHLLLGWHGYVCCSLSSNNTIQLRARSNLTLESRYIELCSQHLPCNSTLESTYMGRAFIGIPTAVQMGSYPNESSFQRTTSTFVKSTVLCKSISRGSKTI